MKQKGFNKQFYICNLEFQLNLHAMLKYEDIGE